MKVYSDDEIELTAGRVAWDAAGRYYAAICALEGISAAPDDWLNDAGRPSADVLAALNRAVGDRPHGVSAMQMFAIARALKLHAVPDGDFESIPRPRRAALELFAAVSAVSERILRSEAQHRARRRDAQP